MGRAIIDYHNNLFFFAFRPYDQARAAIPQTIPHSKVFHPSMLSFKIYIFKGGYERAWSILD